MITKNQKISKANKGKRRTEEQRTNITNGIRNYFANEEPEKRQARINKIRQTNAIKTLLFQNFKEKFGLEC